MSVYSGRAFFYLYNNEEEKEPPAKILPGFNPTNHSNQWLYFKTSNLVVPSNLIPESVQVLWTGKWSIKNL